MLALAACHMVTAPIFLNGRVALGALLGVGGDPVSRLRVILTLLQPHLDQRTRSRLVVVQTAAKAKIMLA